MKYNSVLMMLLFVSFGATAQTIVNVDTLQRGQSNENIVVTRLASDSLSSSFIIWIKDAVRAHKHLLHAEQVYVLEGTGIMQLGDATLPISSGSYIQIPKNTVHSVKVTSDTPMKVLSIQSPKFTGKDRHFIE